MMFDIPYVKSLSATFLAVMLNKLSFGTNTFTLTWKAPHMIKLQSKQIDTNKRSWIEFENPTTDGAPSIKPIIRKKILVSPFTLQWKFLQKLLSWNFPSDCVPWSRSKDRKRENVRVVAWIYRSIVQNESIMFVFPRIISD